MIEWTFPPPGKPMTANERVHWRAWSARVKTWRNTAAMTVPRKYRRANLGYSQVIVTIPVVGNRRRDPHNWYPTVKAVVDGLVDAGVFADDDEKHLEVASPALAVGATDVKVTIIQVRPRGCS